MDYKNLTATCGRDCFNCPFYLAGNNERLRSILSRRFEIELDKAQCSGCRNIKGDVSFLGFGKCKIYDCSESKNIEFCFECEDFPCDYLHPLADKADKFPHNLKVFNLCLIKKLGVENWAKTKAKNSFDKYFKGKLE